MFSRAAPTYDQIGPKFFSHFGQRLVDLARISPGSRVLDVACGRGAVLFPAARAVGAMGEVTGIDLAEGMINETQHEIQRMKLDNVDVQQMDAEVLQYADATFDYVLSGLALLFFPSPGRALGEMHRVLKPLGYLAVSTWDRRGDDLWRWFEEDLFDAHMPSKRETNSSPGHQAPPPMELDTPELLEAGIRTAGFAEVQVMAERVDMVYRSAQEWWDALWGTSCRLMLEEIEQATGMEGLEGFRQAAFDHLKTMWQEDGIPQSWPVLFALATKPQV